MNIVRIDKPGRAPSASRLEKLARDVESVLEGNVKRMTLNIDLSAEEMALLGGAGFAELSELEQSARVQAFLGAWFEPRVAELGEMIESLRARRVESSS